MRSRDMLYLLKPYTKLICHLVLLTISLLVQASAMGFNNSSEKIIFSNATIIVGTNNQILKDMAVIVEGKWIKKIVPVNEITDIKNSKRVDLTGKFIIPGLIESHSHTIQIGSEKPYTNALYGGITTIRDMGGDGGYLRGLQLAVKKGKFIGPDIYFSALMAGKQFIENDRRVKLATPNNYKLGQAPWMREVNENSDIEKIISDAKISGATGIKLYSDLPTELVNKLSKEASKAAIKVWSHAYVNPATVEDVLNAGVDSISHAPFLLFPQNWNLRKHGTTTFDESQLDDSRLNLIFSAMKKHNTFLDPNLFLSIRVLKLKVQEENILRKKIDMVNQVIQKAHQAGIKIVTGTDIFLPKKMGALPELHQEIELLVKNIKMTPLDAIEAATFNGALLLGIDNTHGTIAAGKVADFVVLNDDPSVDISNTRKIHFVVKNGITYQK